MRLWENKKIKKGKEGLSKSGKISQCRSEPINNKFILTIK